MYRDISIDHKIYLVKFSVYTFNKKSFIKGELFFFNTTKPLLVNCFQSSLIFIINAICSYCRKSRKQTENYQKINLPKPL